MILKKGVFFVQVIAYFIISLLASIAGAICGIGGGVIIKPSLDLFHLDSVATISFLSGCTVLAMSCYSVTKSMRAGESKIDLKIGTPLAIGAAIGGGIAIAAMIAVAVGLIVNANKKMKTEYALKGTK